MSRILSVDDLQISGPEWLIKHVLTVEDCNRAEGALADVLAKIERDMASDRFAVDPDWRPKVIRVRALRQAAMDHVRAKREALKNDYVTNWNAHAIAVLEQIDPVAYQHVVDATNHLLSQRLQQAA